jgi:glutamate synthase domain-containing protein 2
MMRRVFYLTATVSLLLVLLIALVWPPVLYLLIIVVPYILIGIHDVLSKKHSVLRNYPVVGHLRFMFEYIRPEIQQYFVNTNLSGRPFNREVRSLVYQRAKKVRDTIPFGTEHDLTALGHESAYHSLSPQRVPTEEMRVNLGGPDCSRPYSASRLNVSAMSYGALSTNAILALNKGAKMGGFAHNTGEGGLSPYHLQGGGDIIWQIGTAYFGCRTEAGQFDLEQFKQKAQLEQVKMIEVKLSQGAKPSHGGILPAVKITKEIALIRGVKRGQDCVSPPAHSAFTTPKELLEFVSLLRRESGGKPVGFKLCIGIRQEFMAICKAMLATGITPDFITVDGAEGGTGAAPVEFTNRLGTPINEAIAFVHNCLVGVNLREKIRIIASGKVATGFDMTAKIALGADMCNSARAMMFALGCIQSLSCNTNKCPTGVATQDKIRMRALDVNDKYRRVAHYHQATVESFRDFVGAMGKQHVSALGPQLISRHNDELSVCYANIFTYLQPGQLLSENIPQEYADHWAMADAQHF